MLDVSCTPFQVHLGPHKCNQCGYSSIKLANMRLHKMTHSGEKPNQCPQCDFSSITADHMTTHMRRSQTGEKPYKCEHCAHSFVSAGNLQRHKMSIYSPQIRAYMIFVIFSTWHIFCYNFSPHKNRDKTDFTVKQRKPQTN